MSWSPSVGLVLLRGLHIGRGSARMAKKAKAAPPPPPPGPALAATPVPPTGGPIVRRAPGQFHLKVCVQPNCAQSALTEVTGDELRMRLNAPPRDGQANLEVINVLAKALGCSKADLRIVQGQKARQKVVEIQGQPADQTSESFLIKIQSLLD